MHALTLPPESIHNNVQPGTILYIGSRQRKVHL